MKLRAKLQNIQLDFKTRQPIVSFSVSCKTPENLEKYKDKDLAIEVKQHRERRSLDANACLWACLGDLATAMRTDSWSMYLYMLERYGKFTLIQCRPEAVPDLQRVWRETKVVGARYDADGEKLIDVLCFFGSSTYSTAEFSRLLDGVISEMKDIGLDTPPDEEMKAMLEEMERRDQARRSKEARKSSEKQGQAG